MSRTFPALAFARLGAPAAAPARLALLPLMGMFVLLLPFLLLCLSLAEIHTVPLAAAAGTGAGVVRIEMRPTSLNLDVWLRRSRAMRLTVARRLGSGHTLAAAQAELAEALDQIRRRFPGVDVLRVVPAPSTPYEEVVALLDALQRGVRSPRLTGAAPRWRELGIGGAAGAP